MSATNDLLVQAATDALDPTARAPRVSRTTQLLRDLGVDPRTFLDEDLPKGSFSHSQYTSFKICAKAYEFRYVEGLSSAPSVSMGKGLALHSGIETILRAKMNKLPLPSLMEQRKLVSESFQKNTEAVEDWGDEDAKVPPTPRDHEAVALAAYDVFHTFALPKLNPIAVEKGFAVKFGTVPMIGYIDMIDDVPDMDVTGLSPELQAEAPRRRVVVDHKSTKTSWSEDNVARNPQLTLYADVEGTPHVRIDQIVLLRKGPVYRPMPSTRDPHAISVLKEDVEEVVDMIKAGTFPKTQIDNRSCNEKKCSYWLSCRGKRS